MAVIEAKIFVGRVGVPSPLLTDSQGKFIVLPQNGSAVGGPIVSERDGACTMQIGDGGKDTIIVDLPVGSRITAGASNSSHGKFEIVVK